MNSKYNSYKIIYIIVIGLAAIFFQGCEEKEKSETAGKSSESQEESSQFAGSCQTEANCIDHTGSAWTPDVVKRICETTTRGAVYSEKPCPTENLAGSCYSLDGTTDESVSRYYSPKTSKAKVEAICNVLQARAEL